MSTLLNPRRGATGDGNGVGKYTPPDRREGAGSLSLIWRQNHHRKTASIVLLAQKNVPTIRLANQRKKRLNSRNVEMMEKLCGQWGSRRRTEATARNSVQRTMERQLQKPRNAIHICRWRLGCVIVRRCTVLSCQNILAEYPLHHISSAYGRCFVFDPASKHSPKTKHTKRLTQVDERRCIQWFVRGRGGQRSPLPCGNQSRITCEIGPILE